MRGSEQTVCAQSLSRLLEISAGVRGAEEGEVEGAKRARVLRRGEEQEEREESALTDSRNVWQRVEMDVGMRGLDPELAARGIGEVPGRRELKVSMGERQNGSEFGRIASRPEEGQHQYRRWPTPLRCSSKS